MTKKFLHVGCGQNTKIHTTPYFNTDEWEEVRLDMDESAKPDILLSMADLHKLPLRSYDAIYCAHALEHVYSHQVPFVVSQFIRLVRLGGQVVIVVPDLQTVAKYILEDKLLDVMYNSPAGPIGPLDTLYGHREALKMGNESMAHRTGFTAGSLGEVLGLGGFQTVGIYRDVGNFEIRSLAIHGKIDGDAMKELVSQHFPPTKNETYTYYNNTRKSE